MKKESIYRNLLLIGSSFVVHVFVFFDFKYLMDITILPEQWQIQSLLLILFSLLASIFMAILPWIRVFLLVVRFLCIVILGYPLGEYLNIETILLISIIIESVYYLPERYGAIASLFMIFIIFKNQKPAISWGELAGRADDHQLLFFIFISMLILFLSLTLKKIFKISDDRASDVARLDYAVGKLTEINLGYQNYAASVEHDSIEKERKRISREMHDIIGYTLTNQLMIIQAVLSMKQMLPIEIESLLLQSQQQTRDGMSQARSALYQLREFSPGNESGLKLIIKLVRTFEQVTGICIKIHFCNTPDSLGKNIDKVLYRLLQEGLTNAFRHGRATKISIILSVKDGFLRVSMWDNGIGADKINEGIGLMGMRERVESVKGDLETSSLQSGFIIKVSIPYIGRV